MDDNIYMEPSSCISPTSSGNTEDAAMAGDGFLHGNDDGGDKKSWCPSYILDFSDLSVG